MPASIIGNGARSVKSVKIFVYRNAPDTKRQEKCDAMKDRMKRRLEERKEKVN